jgi:hypothetical protein
VADQRHARAVVHVAVVGDIHQLLRQHSLLDPAMEHSHGAMAVDDEVGLREDLELNSMYVHRC